MEASVLQSYNTFFNVQRTQPNSYDEYQYQHPNHHQVWLVGSFYHYLDQTLFKYLFRKKHSHSLNMTNDCIENCCRTIESYFKMMCVRVWVCGVEVFHAACTLYISTSSFLSRGYWPYNIPTILAMTFFFRVNSHSHQFTACSLTNGCLMFFSSLM